MKTLKRMIFPLIVSTLISLTGYSQERDTLHSDYANFIKDNHTKKYENAWKIENKEYNTYFSGGNVLKILTGLAAKPEPFFIDNYADGLKLNQGDKCIINNRVKEFDELSPEEQLKYVAEYDSLKVKAMHDSKYKNY